MNPDDIIRYQEYDPSTNQYVVRGSVFPETTVKKLNDDEAFAPIEAMFRERDERRRSTNNVIKFPVKKNRYR